MKNDGRRSWDEIWVEVRPWRLFARVGRDGPTQAPDVVLVHGMNMSSRYMIPTLLQLAPHYRVYAPDLPGYGRSSKPPQALAPHELADALADWMEAVGLSDAALVGNSYGCNIIAEFAQRHPDRITRAVLQGPTAGTQEGSLGARIRRMMKNSPYEPKSLALIMAGDYTAAGVRIARETLNHALTHPLEEKLPGVRVPTLVVRGARDTLVSQQWAERVTSLLPDGQLKVIPGAAHTLNYAAPLEFSRVIRPFLDA